MRRIRVLVVDDAVVVRRLVTDVLSADPEIEVVGIAANGRIALQKIVQLAPDLITLDIEMPEMNGLETVTELRKTWTQLPVIMFSTLSERGAAATLDALARGATDYVTKPANVGSVTVAQQRVRDELIPKIKSLCAGVLRASGNQPPPVIERPTVVAHAGAMAGTHAPVPRVTAGARGPIAILAIGSSTGGPNALADLIPRLPADFPVPIVITQHMPPMFTKFLADRLNTMSKLTVREATGGEVLSAGTVWIAPGDHHLVLRKSGQDVVTALTQDPPENSCRPSVDVMLRSVVSCYDRRVLSVILTGMGQDGLRGCEAVHAAGGAVLAQDEDTSVVWGMPGFVARAGIADAVLPLPRFAEAIVDRIRPVKPTASHEVPALAPRVALSPIAPTGAAWR